MKKEKTDVSIVEMRTAGHNTTMLGTARELIVIDATVRLQTKNLLRTSSEGVLLGSSEGDLDGSSDGSNEGSSEGNLDGSFEGNDLFERIFDKKTKREM